MIPDESPLSGRSLGPESFEKGLRLLSPLGRMICYGFSSLVTGRKRNLWHAVTSVLGKQKVNPITLMNKNVGVFGLNLAHLFEERELLTGAGTPYTVFTPYKRAWLARPRALPLPPSDQPQR